MRNCFFFLNYFTKIPFVKNTSREELEWCLWKNLDRTIGDQCGRLWTMNSLRQLREVWICLTGSMMACLSQFRQASHGVVIKAHWPWPFWSSKVQAPQFLRSPRAWDSFSGVLVESQPVGCSYGRPDFSLSFYPSTDITLSSSLCDPGDLWPWSLL